MTITSVSAIASENQNTRLTNEGLGWTSHWYPSHGCGIGDNHTAKVGRWDYIFPYKTKGEAKISSGSKKDTVQTSVTIAGAKVDSSWSVQTAYRSYTALGIHPVYESHRGKR
ncbi:MAG: hypothetical protein ACRCYE_11320 [Sarcina sp.]